MTEGLMNKVEKKLDVLCLGAAVVDIPLRPVSREVFDIESYPVDNIAMAVGGDAMNESTIISRLGCKTGLMAAIEPFNPLELVARVKSQLRRYTQLGNAAESGDSIYTVGGLSINDDLKEVTVDGEVVKLTPIEYNILLLLVKNQGKVFSINQIYESIWNEDAIGADNTVAVHIRHIREKIEINPKEPRYLKVVWGVGYKIDKN